MSACVNASRKSGQYRIQKIRWSIFLLLDQADTLSDSEDDNCAIINGESDHEDSDRGPLHWNEAALQRPRALYQGDSRWTKRRKLLKQVAAAARMLLWGIHV